MTKQGHFKRFLHENFDNSNYTALFLQGKVCSLQAHSLCFSALCNMDSY